MTDIEMDGAPIGWPGWLFVVNADINTVSVTAPEGHRITRDEWRAMPMGFVLRRARVFAVDRLARETFPFLPTSDPNHLRIVAELYRFAIQHDVPPRVLLEHHFCVSSRTVTRWLDAVRIAGLLGTWDEERKNS